MRKVLLIASILIVAVGLPAIVLGQAQPQSLSNNTGVTIDTTQTITGAKTFSTGVNADGLRVGNGGIMATDGGIFINGVNAATSTWTTDGGLKTIGGTLFLTGDMADSSVAVAAVIRSSVNLANSTAKILSLRDNVSSEVSYIDLNGGGVFRGTSIGTFAANQIQPTTAAALSIRGALTSGTASGGNVIFQSANALSGSTDLLVSFKNDTVTKSNITKEGTYVFSKTDSSGTPGAATIDKGAGVSAVALGAASVVITSNQAATTSVISVTPYSSALTDCVGWYVTPAAGSFTVTCPAGVTGAAWSFAWHIH